jgi:predicted metal-dependent hydrolase
MNNSKASKKKIKMLYEEWLMRKAKALFGKKLRQHSKGLQVYPQQINIKNLKNR